MIELSKRDITYLPGVGPKKAEILKKELNIHSYEDLLYYFPYKYIDRTRFYKVVEINESMPFIQLKGQIRYFETVGEGRNRRLIAKFSDGSGIIDLVWFKGFNFILDKYKPGIDYIVFGKPSSFGNWVNLLHPDIDVVSNAKQVTGGLIPHYHTTEKMKKAFLNSRSIQNLQYALLELLKWQLPETLSPDILKQTGMISLTDAIGHIHFPESQEMLRKAEARLKFEELFFIQLNILRSAEYRKRKLKGILFPSVGECFNTFYKDYLPFELTNAQKRVVREIRGDLGSGRQMNRLLQGDVGSGKTLVALLAMLLAIDNGYQACMMAPTEILATQHFATLKEFLGDMNIKVALLTGSTKKRERNSLLPAIANGEIQILVGTHALIEETVQFDSLGLAIIDEQHRFGVEQRSKLWTKNSIIPHVLVMTATPIPRTLAMTLYGDLDVSVIDELPPGRKPIKTLHIYDNKRGELYEFIRREVGLGRQIYVVYPLIEESKKSDYKNLEAGFEWFKELFPNFNVCMVHGRMKAAEKEVEMQKFISGEAHILMATTVIEVGVNVPNASVMIIESAERFGLSQLHQLRGRVGRGAEQSYCVLVSSYKLSNETRKRLEIMVNSNDGFVIAEADLRLRGHGDLEGTRQSGDSLNLKIASLAADGQILQYARDLATSLLESDPELTHPSHRILSERLTYLFGRKVDWGLIS
ncbi:ATP-dependent DNA helicase RecG [Parabacteroides sp. OttesenSCG-928-N08]|nr:ATP-dependent DNA helicase RecG [Parabacteroides sp. OttesenSCG-928-N08]